MSSGQDWRESVTVHPAADLFPMMSGTDFDELVADIRENGQRDPIARTPDGAILDGRNRYRACLWTMTEPKFETVADEPYRYVVSRNLHRRHLTDTQRAMIAGKIAARARGQYARSGANTSAEAFAPDPPSQAQTEQLLKVSHGAMGRARTVHARGTEALVAAVEDEAVPLTTAARVAAERTPDEQDRFVEQVAAGGDVHQLAPPSKRPMDPQQPAPEPEDDVVEASVTPLHPEPPSIPKKERRRGVGPGGKDAKHRWVQVGALHHITEQLDALGYVLDTAEGLDPQITADEAARWADGLAQKQRRLKHLIKMLKERTS